MRLSTIKRAIIALLATIGAALAFAAPSQAYLHELEAEGACAAYSGPSVASGMGSYGRTPMAWQPYTTPGHLVPVNAPNRFADDHIAVSVGWYDTGFALGIAYRCGVTGSDASATVISFGQEWIGWL